MSQIQPVSTRPYLVRAIYEWCTDNGFTPYMAVKVDRNVQVPMEFVNKGEIVLNVSFDATSGLNIGNDFVRFQARFAGITREIIVPVSHVIAVYAKENGQGMAFPAPEIIEEEQNVSSAPEGGASLHLVEEGESKTKMVPSQDNPEDDLPPQGGSKQKNPNNSNKPSLRIVK